MIVFRICCDPFLSFFRDPYCKPFTGGTWVTEAIKDEGTTESCSIATLMNHTTAFINSFFQRAFGQKKYAKNYMSRLH
jgi:hypothetical protein